MTPGTGASLAALFTFGGKLSVEPVRFPATVPHFHLTLELRLPGWTAFPLPFLFGPFRDSRSAPDYI